MIISLVLNNCSLARCRLPSSLLCRASTRWHRRVSKCHHAVAFNPVNRNLHYSTMNPSLTPPEIGKFHGSSCRNVPTDLPAAHQLKIAQPKIIFAYPSALPAFEECLARTPVTTKPILIAIDSGVVTSTSTHNTLQTLDGLVALAQHSESQLPPFKFKPGEARTRTAFLCFSSGTTGVPKAVAISHYNVIFSVIQCTGMWRINDDYAPWDQRRFRPGDVTSAGMFASIPFGKVLSEFCSIAILPWVNSRLTAIL